MATSYQRWPVSLKDVFEERLFELTGVLHRTDAPTADHIPHELAGGPADLAHVEEADPEHATLTRDVDLVVRRRHSCT
jgi:hypothetical protein